MDADSEDVTIEDLKRIVAKIVTAAEATRLPSRAYAWHRRFVLGIDHSIEAAERRALDASFAELTSLRSSAEMVSCWLRSQRESDPAERWHLMAAARRIYGVLK